MTGKRYSRLFLVACLVVAWPVGAQSVKALGPDDFSAPDYDHKLDKARAKLSAEQERRRKLEQDATKDKKRVKELEQVAAAEKQRIRELEDALRREREARVGATRPVPHPSTPTAQPAMAATRVTHDPPSDHSAAPKLTVTDETQSSDKRDCPDMAVIPAGEYVRGNNSSSYTDDKPESTVKISKPFLLCKTEVTQGQWRAVMGSQPSYFKSCGDDCSVENVSWNEVQEFINKLNAKTGKTYRLLGEAEWEYVCRTTNKRTDCYQRRNEIATWKHIIASSSSGSGSTQMNRELPNWEWVEDCYRDSYRDAPSDGSAWISGKCDSRVLRGGSFYLEPHMTRSNEFKFQWTGVVFRLARALQSP